MDAQPKHRTFQPTNVSSKCFVIPSMKFCSDCIGYNGHILTLTIHDPFLSSTLDLVILIKCVHNNYYPKEQECFILQQSRILLKQVNDWVTDSSERHTHNWFGGWCHAMT